MIETFGGYTLDALDTYRGEGWPGGVVRDLIAALKHEREARVVLKEAAKKQGKHLDSLYADSMIAHRWFEAAFGEDFRGRDFAAKCPMAEERLQQIRQERDHFKAAYARKLVEHSATLADAMQLCKERDEARAKLAATEAHCATLRAALEVARGYLPHREDSAEICYDWCPLCRVEAALAATPADSLHAVQREAIREWCSAIQDDAITSWLDHTPEPLGPGDLLKRLLFAAGRDRAVRELQQKTKEFDARAFHVGGPAEKAFIECRDACSSRADEIAKEGK